MLFSYDLGLYYIYKCMNKSRTPSQLDADLLQEMLFRSSIGIV